VALVYRQDQNAEMMRQFATTLSIAVFSTLIASDTRAEQYVAKLDPQSSKVAFSLGATMHTVEGTVRATEGALTFEPGRSEVSGRIVVDARTANTASQGRDKKMHHEVLESEKYPEIVLIPAKLQGSPNLAGVSRVILEGTLTIHGSTHPISIPLEIAITGQRYTASGSFKVPFVAWGMNDPSVFVLRVEKFFTVSLAIQGTLEPVVKPS
jgi:polyisoprenoid-binding protein YceI